MARPLVSFPPLAAAFAAIVALAAAAPPAHAQDNPVDAAAGSCIAVTSRPSLGHPTRIRQLRNTCGYDVTLAWCVEGYHRADTSKPPEGDPENSRNCSHPRATRGNWNPAGFWYNRDNIRAGATMDIYADDQNSGPARYAVCRAEVEGERVSVRSISTNETSYGCYTYGGSSTAPAADTGLDTTREQMERGGATVPSDSYAAAEPSPAAATPSPGPSTAPRPETPQTSDRNLRALEESRQRQATAQRRAEQGLASVADGISRMLDQRREREERRRATAERDAARSEAFRRDLEEQRVFAVRERARLEADLERKAGTFGVTSMAEVVRTADPAVVTSVPVMLIRIIEGDRNALVNWMIERRNGRAFTYPTQVSTSDPAQYELDENSQTFADMVERRVEAECGNAKCYAVAAQSLSELEAFRSAFHDLDAYATVAFSTSGEDLSQNLSSAWEDAWRGSPEAQQREAEIAAEFDRRWIAGDTLDLPAGSYLLRYRPHRALYKLTDPIGGELLKAVKVSSAAGRLHLEQRINGQVFEGGCGFELRGGYAACSPDGFHPLMEHPIPLLPAGPVQVGDQWVFAGNQMIYTLTRVEDGVAHIQGVDPSQDVVWAEFDIRLGMLRSYGSYEIIQ